MAMGAVDAIEQRKQPNVLLVINCGSSSLKAACFQVGHQRLSFHFRIDQRRSIEEGFEIAFAQLFKALGDIIPNKIAHRFVFGGEVNQTSRLIDRVEIKRLELLVPYAPLHLPLNLLGVQRCTERFCEKSVSQWACFDNAFHSTLPALAYRFAIPAQYQMRRFGFHGLNYAYIAKQLPKLLDERIATGRVVIAHLGSGCSLCMLENLQSVDTSMGYSTAGGIPMATRSGDLDPGLLLKLAQTMPVSELNRLIFHQSGLLALSDGESSDMQTLLNSQSANSQFAIQYFTRSICATIGAYAAKMGGIEALIFTGGIGEHAHEIRKRICDPLSFLGFSICESANLLGATAINAPASKPILIIPADEEAEMASMIC